jgi:hypothetical protein
MVIFEAPAKDGQGRIRVASIGSCRSHAPIAALVARGDLKVQARNSARTHTVGEALQMIEIALGEKSIPEFLGPFVLSPNELSRAEALASVIREGVDVFVLEISHDRQFTFGDVCLQAHLLSTHLVHARRKALLEWFRNLCNGRAIDEACIQGALEGLRREGFEADAPMDGLLRGIGLEQQSGETIAGVLGALKAKLGGRWVVVGHFAVPGQEGAVMADRRALNEKLRGAAAVRGAAFYDPSDLIAEYGPVAALDAKGTHTLHYAPSFHATVGEKLLALAGGG